MRFCPIITFPWNEMWRLAYRLNRRIKTVLPGTQSLTAFSTDIESDIEEKIKNDKVVVFMKGCPEKPMCGFSNAVVQIMRMHNVPYRSYDVLEDEALRQGRFSRSCKLPSGQTIASVVPRNGDDGCTIKPILWPRDPSLRFKKAYFAASSALDTFNIIQILDDEQSFNEIMGIKDFSQWPTIPQVYLDGQFVGGCDILLQMHQSGELIEALRKVGVTSALLSGPPPDS